MSAVWLSSRSWVGPALWRRRPPCPCRRWPPCLCLARGCLAFGGGGRLAFVDRERRTDRVGALAEDFIRLGDPSLVLLVALTGDPLELGERLEPKLLQCTEAVDGGTVGCRLAQRRLVGAGHRKPMLVDAVLGLGAVGAFGRSFVAELDDFDALHLAAHRVQVADGVQVAVDRAARRVGTKIRIGLRDEFGRPGRQGHHRRDQAQGKQDTGLATSRDHERTEADGSHRECYPARGLRLKPAVRPIAIQCTHGRPKRTVLPLGGQRTPGRRPQDSRRLVPRSGMRRSRTQ